MSTPQKLSPQKPSTEDRFLSVNHPDYVPGKNPNNFTGIARSVIACDNQGFNNFKIVTLTIEKGKVVNTEYSDPYVNFECIAMLERADNVSIMTLNNEWEHGKTIWK